MMRTECEDEVISFLGTHSATSRIAFHAFGASPIHALYLRGPPGAGKTHAVNSAARACNWTVFTVSDAVSLVVFLSDNSPPKTQCLLLIENADAVLSADATSAPSVALLRAALQAISCPPVIATGSRPLPISLHSVFHQHRIRPLEEDERSTLLRELLPGCDDDGVLSAARMLGAAGPSDVIQLATRASAFAGGGVVQTVHLHSALAMMRRAEVRPASWSSVGGLADVKKRLQMAVEWPTRHASSFARLGVRVSRGVLLHGPPGCSKTTLVRAAASGAGARFISLAAADVYSCYLGEAERILRDVFSQARECAPCILFLDEIDAIAGARGFDGGGGGGAEVSNRVLATLLTEMDGVAGCEGVVVVAATNRLDCVDEALRRPGRFDDVLEVALPDEAARVEILRIHCEGVRLASDVDFGEIARKTEGLSGAHLKGICKEAALAAAREVWVKEARDEGNCGGIAGDLDLSVCVGRRHFSVLVTRALANIERLGIVACDLVLQGSLSEEENEIVDSKSRSELGATFVDHSLDTTAAPLLCPIAAFLSSVVRSTEVL